MGEGAATARGVAQQTSRESTEADFWLFGYGSLIWKPPPHADQRIPGYIEGYVRRFWQASEDHRGTPEAPGRVVTLIERSFWEKLVDPHTATADRVWGVAYHVAPTRAEEVKAYLDVREVNGYTIHHVPFQPANDDERTIQTMAYIGTPENPQFIGPQGSQALAEHIWKSHGPSGENRDYLFKLEESLNELSPDSEDDHVKDLAERVRRLEVASAAKGDSVRKETPT